MSRSYSNNFTTIRGSHPFESNNNFSTGQLGGYSAYLSFNPSGGDQMIHGSLMGRGGGEHSEAPAIQKNALHSVHKGFKKDLSAGSTGNAALQTANIPHTANSRSLKGSGSAKRIGTKSGYVFKR